MQEQALQVIANMLKLQGRVMFVSQTRIGAYRGVHNVQGFIPQTSHVLFGQEKELHDSGILGGELHSYFNCFPYTEQRMRDYWTLVGLATKFNYISLCDPKISLRRELWSIWQEKQIGGFVTLTADSVAKAVETVQQDFAVMGRGDLRNVAFLLDTIVEVDEDGSVQGVYTLKYHDGEIQIVKKNLDDVKVRSVV